MPNTVDSPAQSSTVFLAALNFPPSAENFTLSGSVHAAQFNAATIGIEEIEIARHGDNALNFSHFSR
jgi:hypothetical protein